jgi:hypothetical protein
MYDAVYFCRLSTRISEKKCNFQVQISVVILPWRWRQQDPPKYPYPSTNASGVILQKAMLVTVTKTRFSRGELCSSNAILQMSAFHEIFYRFLLMEKTFNISKLVSYSCYCQYISCEQMESCCYLAVSQIRENLIRLCISRAWRWISVGMKRMYKSAVRSQEEY